MSARVLSSNVLSQARFAHGFSTRDGADPRRLGAAIGFDERKLHQVEQVHGSRVVVARGDVDGMRACEADAIVAEPKSMHAAGVRVADCAPLLVADKASRRVAAVHAGWRGVACGIVPAAVHHLLSADNAGRAADFVAAIGPCIGACCFEVGDDVAAKIVLVSAPEVVVRRDVERGKAYVDLRRALRWQLRAAGMLDEAIDDVPGHGRMACTHCNGDVFDSYRRDGRASGRMIAVIVAG
ncbi:MAG: polyphenol oxidase family protein [Polyangiaceae bacterium]|nr:polyphenol oxidase family protein [Polyangiaceae bacterium]